MGFDQHPNFEVIESLRTTLFSAIKEKQNDYFVSQGRYFQGIETPTAPVDGTELVPIAYGLHPEVGISWNQFAPELFNESSLYPFQVKVDVYDSPTVHGWIFTVTVTKAGLGPDSYQIDGNIWKYQHIEGSEAGQRSGIWDEWYIFQSE